MTNAPTYERLDRSWVRNDADGHTHVTGPDDVSAAHRTYPTGYNAKCGWCWLGAPHSADVHTDRTA